MAWPPPVLPINRSDATPMQTTHPQDHNAVNLAVNDLVVKVSDIILIPTERRRNVPFPLAPAAFISYAQLARLTIPAATRERVASISFHMQITVNTYVGAFNVGLYGGPTLLQLWTVAAVGDRWLDGSADAAIAANTAMDITVSVGTLPAGTNAQTWGSDNVNYLSAVTTRGVGI